MMGRIPVAKAKKTAKGRDESAEADSPKKSGSAAFKVMDKAGVVVTGMLVPQVAAAAWRFTTGRKPPSEARHPQISGREAVAWAVFTGVTTEVAKLLVRRGAARYWVRSTGQLPPGLDELDTDH